jgi:hypothetical protein
MVCLVLKIISREYARFYLLNSGKWIPVYRRTKKFTALFNLVSSVVQYLEDRGDVKAIQLKATASRNPFEKNLYQSHILSLDKLTLFFNTKSTYPGLSLRQMPSLKKLKNIILSNLSPVSEKRSQQQSFLKLER